MLNFGIAVAVIATIVMLASFIYDKTHSISKGH